MIEVSDSTAQGISTNPSFPDDVPTAPLLRLSLQKLLENNDEESQCLFTACKNMGFFYLDLRGTAEGESILRDANKLFDVGEKLFDLELEEKQTYDFSAQKSYYG